jgi:hypothetical protein
VLDAQNGAQKSGCGTVRGCHKRADGRRFLVQMGLRGAVVAEAQNATTARYRSRGLTDLPVMICMPGSIARGRWIRKPESTGGGEPVRTFDAPRSSGDQAAGERRSQFLRHGVPRDADSAYARSNRGRARSNPSRCGTAAHGVITENPHDRVGEM